MRSTYHVRSYCVVKLFLIKMGILRLIAVTLFSASLLAGGLRGAIPRAAQPNPSEAWGMLPEGCEDGVHFLQIDGSQADAISVPNGGELRVTSINC